MRRMSIAMLLCATTLLLDVPPVPAGQAQEGSSKPPAATTEKGQAAQAPCPGMAAGTCCDACLQGQATQTPCPGMAAGTCCDACMQGQGAAAGPKAGQAPAECPCGKMKKGNGPAS